MCCTLLLQRGQLPHFLVGLRTSTHTFWSKPFSKTVFWRKSRKEALQNVKPGCLYMPKIWLYFSLAFYISKYCFISITFAMEKIQQTCHYGLHLLVMRKTFRDNKLFCCTFLTSINFCYFCKKIATHSSLFY